MNDISEIFNVDPNSWIESLSTYQKILSISYIHKQMIMRWLRTHG